MKKTLLRMLLVMAGSALPISVVIARQGSTVPVTPAAPPNSAPGSSPSQAPSPFPQDTPPPPLTPQEVTMRNAVRHLGTRRGHYVLCELQGGRQVVGTIKAIDPRSFTLSTDILGENEKLFYWQLTAPPRRVRAMKQRTTQTVEKAVIAGTIGVGIILGIILVALIAHH